MRAAEEFAKLVVAVFTGCAIISAPLWQQILDALADKGMRL